MLNNIIKESDSVFYTQDSIVSLSLSEIQELLRLAREESPTGTIRLCLHKNIEASLHCMCIVHPNNVCVPPHRHVDKSENITVLHGEMDVIFFSDEGNVTQRISCGEMRSGKIFQVYIPQWLWHTMVVHSEQVCFLETTTGPFIPDAMEKASWNVMKKPRIHME